MNTRPQCSTFELIELGSRIRPLFTLQWWRNVTFIRLLPYLLNILGIFYMISAALSIYSINLHTVMACKAAMDICATPSSLLTRGTT